MPKKCYRAGSGAPARAVPPGCCRREAPSPRAAAPRGAGQCPRAAGGAGPGRGRADAAQRQRSGPCAPPPAPQPLSSRPLGAPPARPHLHSARPARLGVAEPRSAGAADWRVRAQLICMGRGGAPGGAAAEKLSPSRRECPAERPAPRRGQETAGGGPPAAWR